MNQPTVLLDCDGILTDYAQTSVDLVNTLCPELNMKPEDMTSFEASSYVPAGRLNEYWAHCCAQGFVSRLVPYPEAQVAVEQLRKVADVVVVTSYLKRSPTWVHERDRWLKKHFDVNPDHVIHTRAKQHVFGHVLVDDALRNVVPWGFQWGLRDNLTCALLWDKPYNRDVRDLHSEHLLAFTRIGSWEWVHETVDRIARSLANA